MLVKKTVTDFIEELASDSPAPGGGSVAALVGALGAALCVMVTNLSKGEKFSKVADVVKELEAEGEALKNELEKYVDEDMQAFNKVMSAYRLPKITEADKESRSVVIQAALKEAVALPLAIAYSSSRVLYLSTKVIQVGNKNAASDAAVAGIMGYAAIHSALFNVRINLLSIKDNAYLDNVKREVSNLNENAEELYQNIQRLASEAFI